MDIATSRILYLLPYGVVGLSTDLLGLYMLAAVSHSRTPLWPVRRLRHIWLSRCLTLSWAIGIVTLGAYNALGCSKELVLVMDSLGLTILRLLCVVPGIQIVSIITGSPKDHDHYNHHHQHASENTYYIGPYSSHNHTTINERHSVGEPSSTAAPLQSKDKTTLPIAPPAKLQVLPSLYPPPYSPPSNTPTGGVTTTVTPILLPLNRSRPTLPSLSPATALGIVLTVSSLFGGLLLAGMCIFIEHHINIYLYVIFGHATLIAAVRILRKTGCTLESQRPSSWHMRVVFCLAVLFASVAFTSVMVSHMMIPVALGADYMGVPSLAEVGASGVARYWCYAALYLLPLLSF